MFIKYRDRIYPNSYLDVKTQVEALINIKNFDEIVKQR